MSVCRRVIPVLLVRGGSLVKGERFNSWRNIGSPIQAMQVFEARQVDEIVVLDIGATLNGTGIRPELVTELSRHCTTPLTVGGGVRSVEDVRALLRAGADKVSICTEAVRRPELITEAALAFGSQCVTVSIDVSRETVVSHCGGVTTGMIPRSWAARVEYLGAGEILLNNIDRDGTMEGYDLDLIRTVAASVSIPVIAAGGARDYADFLAAFQAGAHAVAAGALWAFTDATPTMARRYLSDQGVRVRQA